MSPVDAYNVPPVFDAHRVALCYKIDQGFVGLLLRCNVEVGSKVRMALFYGHK
jgi:hypothetical protein